jgi:membrane protease YdiL (CAAX protease family)
MATFAIGVITQQWHLAMVGIVYSYLTSAAMWQNFRARLPYLYDPWSEQVPPAPTLMHAMIGISVLVEAVAVLGAILVGLLAVADAGRESLPIAQAMSYGICAAIVSFGMAEFLGNRGVTTRDVWEWQPDASAPSSDWGWRAMLGRRARFLKLLAIGAGGGIALGMVAQGYLLVLQHLPVTSDLLRKAHERMAKVPDLKLWYGISAVGFAPFAEEYLFRGLLYRALDREWGGWRAIVGSAAFFAIYHPALSWGPVFLLGAVNAVLFKRTGRLVPAVALHMVYNAVVIWM